MVTQPTFYGTSSCVQLNHIEIGTNCLLYLKGISLYNSRVTKHFICLCEEVERDKRTSKVLQSVYPPPSRKQNSNNIYSPTVIGLMFVILAELEVIAKIA